MSHHHGKDGNGLGLHTLTANSPPFSTQYNIVPPDGHAGTPAEFRNYHDPGEEVHGTKASRMGWTLCSGGSGTLRT